MAIGSAPEQQLRLITAARQEEREALRPLVCSLSLA
jgi:hypothetical protein